MQELSFSPSYLLQKLLRVYLKLTACSANYPVQVAQLKAPVIDTLRGG